MVCMPRVRINDRLFRSLLGINCQFFLALAQSFEKNRQRWGKIPKNQDDTLLVVGQNSRAQTIFLYFIGYQNFDLFGWVFESNRSHPCVWVQKLLTIVEAKEQNSWFFPKKFLTVWV